MGDKGIGDIPASLSVCKTLSLPETKFRKHTILKEQQKNN